jgi:hypothetical protein
MYPTIQVLLVEQLTTKVAEVHFAKEAVDAIKYSPDGSKLAAGSHDNFIDVYDVTRGWGFQGFGVFRVFSRSSFEHRA